MAPNWFDPEFDAEIVAFARYYDKVIELSTSRVFDAQCPHKR
jgi:hypothetical protein